MANTTESPIPRLRRLAKQFVRATKAHEKAVLSQPDDEYECQEFLGYVNTRVDNAGRRLGALAREVAGVRVGADGDVLDDVALIFQGSVILVPNEDDDVGEVHVAKARHIINLDNDVA